jgi:hypothetical protein
MGSFKKNQGLYYSAFPVLFLRLITIIDSCYDLETYFHQFHR